MTTQKVVVSFLYEIRAKGGGVGLVVEQEELGEGEELVRSSELEYPVCRTSGSDMIPQVITSFSIHPTMYLILC